jgi:hypothetical protein
MKRYLLTLMVILQLCPLSYSVDQPKEPVSKSLYTKLTQAAKVGGSTFVAWAITALAIRNIHDLWNGENKGKEGYSGFVVSVPLTVGAAVYVSSQALPYAYKSLKTAFKQPLPLEAR